MQVPIELKVKVGRVGNSLRVTLPKPVLDQLNIKEGDILGLSITDGEIVLRKLESK